MLFRNRFLRLKLVLQKYFQWNKKKQFCEKKKKEPNGFEKASTWDQKLINNQTSASFETKKPKKNLLSSNLSFSFSFLFFFSFFSFPFLFFFVEIGSCDWSLFYKYFQMKWKKEEKKHNEKEQKETRLFSFFFCLFSLFSIFKPEFKVKHSIIVCLPFPANKFVSIKTVPHPNQINKEKLKKKMEFFFFKEK